MSKVNQRKRFVSWIKTVPFKGNPYVSWGGGKNDTLTLDGEFSIYELWGLMKHIAKLTGLMKDVTFRLDFGGFYTYETSVKFLEDGDIVAIQFPNAHLDKG